MGDAGMRAMRELANGFRQPVVLEPLILGENGGISKMTGKMERKGGTRAHRAMMIQMSICVLLGTMVRSSYCDTFHWSSFQDNN